MKKTVLCLISVMLAAAIVAAQEKPAPAKTATEKMEKVEKKPTPKPDGKEPRLPELPPQPVNVKIEFTITDQAGPGEPAKKVVSMIVGDRQNNSIRSTANVRVAERPGPGMPASFNYREVRINIDARPALLKEGKISLSFGLEYLPTQPRRNEDASSDPGLASLNERMGLVLESGKSVMVSQAADPASDRKITVEVLVTILR